MNLNHHILVWRLPYYLIDKIKEEGTYLRKDSSHFANKDIDIIRDRVSTVDPKIKLLNLEQQDAINYDKLLIATGSHPITPPIEGMDLPGIHSCWTLEDGRNIVNKAKPGSNVVLMGAGFIGCIILESLALRKVNLTVIEMGDRMVPRMMGPNCW